MLRNTNPTHTTTTTRKFVVGNGVVVFSLCLFLISSSLSPFSVSTVVAARKDRSAPHPHRGILSPYEPGPFSVEINADDEDLLQQGKAVMKQNLPKPGQSAGGAICIQDIMAPKSAVWNQILDLEAYQGKVPKVLCSKNYCVRRNQDGSATIKTKMVLGVLPGYSYESYYDHKYQPDRDSLVWSLDYDKTSDFDDVAGHWHVEEHPSKPGCSRVFYACDIKTFGSVPGPVLGFISKAALRQATSWVKKESEAKPRHVDNPVAAAFAKAPELVTTTSK